MSAEQTLSSDQVEQRIPHRPPMRLIDEIVSLDQRSIVCRKTFREDEFFVQGHFPGDPIVPGVIQCECCLQAGAILLSKHTPEDGEPQDGKTVPVVTRMDAVKFKRIVRPGDTIEVHATLNDHLSNAYYMTGKVLLGGKLAARLEFACSITKSGG